MYITTDIRHLKTESLKPLDSLAFSPLDIFTVYDKHEECPAWAAMDECTTSNWTWMMDNCPRSCDVPRK